MHVLGVPIATANWGVNESTVVCNQIFGKRFGQNIIPDTTYYPGSNQ